MEDLIGSVDWPCRPGPGALTFICAANLQAAIPRDEDEVHIMHIDKAEIIAILRARGLDDRADWVDRQLPDIVDTYQNGALLQMLNIDLSTMSPVDVAPPQPQS